MSLLEADDLNFHMPRMRNKLDRTSEPTKKLNSTQLQSRFVELSLLIRGQCKGSDIERASGSEREEESEKN